MTPAKGDDVVEGVERRHSLGAAPRRRSPKMSERIARQIVDYIIQNKLSEGTMLPVESELVEQLDVGRTTLREALLLLETWGVITIKAGRNGGPIVRRLGRDGVREALALQLQFAAASLQDVIEARTAVEPMCARLAAARMQAEEIELLDASVARMRAGLSSKSAFLAENAAFHSIIAESTRSVVLHAFIDAIKTISDGAVAGVEYSLRQREAVAAAHERITEAIRTGNTDLAEKEMRAHLGEARDYWHKLGGIIDKPIYAAGS